MSCDWRRAGHVTTSSPLIGCRDGRLVQRDAALQPTGREAQLPAHLGSIRSVGRLVSTHWETVVMPLYRTVAEGAGSQLLVGTTKNSILTGNMELSFQEVMVGHMEEVTALAARPSQGQFLTAGHDR